MPVTKLEDSNWQ